MTRAVGLVGLGVMGSAMARRLAGSGIPVIATSRSATSRDGLEGTEGVTVLPGPAAVTAQLATLEADPATELLVLTSLPSGPEVAAVATGPGGLLDGIPPGRHLLLVDTSTCDPADTRALAERLAAAGHRQLDAPVSGGPTGVRDGTLSVMVGGDAEALQVAEPVLSALAGRVVHCGGSGAGQIAKAANQLIVACTLEAVAEALSLAAGQGLDPALVREALLGGYAASRILHLQGARMLARDFTPGGSIGLLAKDVRIVQGLAARAGIPVPALDATAGQVNRLAATDPGIDHSALISLLATVGPASTAATPPGSGSSQVPR